MALAVRIVLFCLIGAISAAPGSPPTAYDTIVVGLGSAGVTAATTLARAGRRVLGLEAQDRVGGRVFTVPFGDGIVEQGAEWIHGNQGSRVYDLAIANNVTILQQGGFDGLFRSDGGNLDKDLFNELLKFYVQINEGPKDGAEPLGVFITRKLMEYITEKRPEVLNDRDFITEFLAFVELASNNLEGSNSWNDVTTDDSYETLGGPQENSWGRSGYKTFFDIMLNKFNGGPGLANLDIKLQTEVTSISVPQRPEERAVVTCKNGDTYEADNVIVTVSLGVLKAKHSSLFTSPLPQNKTTAIEKMSIGVVDKIIVSFDTPWWPRNFSFGMLIWTGADKKKLGEADRWTAKVPFASRPMGSSNTLTLWTIGEVAKEVESLPVDVVKRQSVELLQRFIGDTLNITVPQPTGIIKSTWYLNPFTRGSYTFDNILTPQYPQARSWLGAPLTDSAGAPRVLFAGEATNINHFSTVHGASETGYREAMRLLPQN